MKGYNRLEQIMDFLKSHNLVTVDQLVAATNASPATIPTESATLPRFPTGRGCGPRRR